MSEKSVIIDGDNLPRGWEKLDRIEVLQEEGKEPRFNGIIELGEGDNKFENRVMLPDLAEMWGYKADPEKVWLRQQVQDLSSRVDELEARLSALEPAAAAPGPEPQPRPAPATPPIEVAPPAPVTPEPPTVVAPVTPVEAEPKTVTPVPQPAAVVERQPVPDRRYRHRNTWLARKWYGYEIPEEVDYYYTDPVTGRPFIEAEDDEIVYVNQERSGRTAAMVAAGALALLGIGYTLHEVEENEQALNRLAAAEIQRPDTSAEQSRTVIIGGKRINIDLDRAALRKLNRIYSYMQRANRTAAQREWKIFNAELKHDDADKNAVIARINQFERKVNRELIHDHGHEMLAIHGDEFTNGKPNSYFHPNKSINGTNTTPAK